MPYEEMDGKFYVDRNSSLRTITWKDDEIPIPNVLILYVF